MAGSAGGFYSDAAYSNDYVLQVTVPTTGGGVKEVALPTIGDGSTQITWRSLTVRDVTLARGGTANALISVYVRVDGHAPIETNGGPWTAANGGDGSFGRIVKAGETIVINRILKGAIEFLNGGANAQTIELQFGG